MRIRTALFPLILLMPLLASAQTCQGPGKERWPVKTSLAAGAALGHATPVALSALMALPGPGGVRHDDPRFENRVIPPFPNSLHVREGQLLRTTGWLYLVALEKGDCDFHLQISPQSHTLNSPPGPNDDSLIVEAPAPRFLRSAGLQQAGAAIRQYIETKLLRGHLPSNRASVMIHAVCVEAAGQLFYDDAHLKANGAMEVRGKRGLKSHTLWELHPITSFRIVAPARCSG